MSDLAPFIELKNVSCRRGAAAIQGVSLSFAPATMTLVMGDAGADLLLRLVGLHERPDDGEIYFEGHRVSELDEAHLQSLRSRKVGFLFPSPYVLPGLSLAENVAMPLFRLLGDCPEAVAKQTDCILDYVGLSSRFDQDAGSLSLADQNRLALARALVHSPLLLVLDQVGENVPPVQMAAFWELVEEACREFSLAAIALVTRRPDPCRPHRVLKLDAGTVSEFAGTTAP